MPKMRLSDQEIDEKRKRIVDSFDINTVIGTEDGNMDIQTYFLAKEKPSQKCENLTKKIQELFHILEMKTVFDNRNKFGIVKSFFEQLRATGGIQKMSPKIQRKMVFSLREKSELIRKAYKNEFFAIKTYDGSQDVSGLDGIQNFLSITTKAFKKRKIEETITPFTLVSIKNIKLSLRDNLQTKIIREIDDFITQSAELLEKQPILITGSNIAGSIANLLAIRLWNTRPEMKIGLLTFGAPAIWDEQQISYLSNKINENSFHIFANCYSYVPFEYDGNLELIIDPIFKINEFRNPNSFALQVDTVLSEIPQNIQSALILSENRFSFNGKIVNEFDLQIEYIMGVFNQNRVDFHHPSTYPKLLVARDIQYSLLEQLMDEFKFDNTKSLIQNTIISSKGPNDLIDMTSIRKIFDEIKNYEKYKTRKLRSNGKNLNFRFYFGNTEHRLEDYKKIDSANFFYMTIKNNRYTFKDLYNDEKTIEIDKRIEKYINRNEPTKIVKFLKKMEKKGKILTIYGVGVAGGIANLFVKNFGFHYPKLKIRLITFGAPAVFSGESREIMAQNPMMPTRNESEYQDGAEVPELYRYREELDDQDRVPKWGPSDEFEAPPIDDANIRERNLIGVSEEEEDVPYLPEVDISDYSKTESQQPKIKEKLEFQKTEGFDNLTSDSYNFYLISEYDSKIIIDPVIKIIGRLLNPNLACIYEGYGFEIQDNNMLGKLLDIQEESTTRNEKIFINGTSIKPIEYNF